MTVKELKKVLMDVNDNLVVKIDVDGFEQCSIWNAYKDDNKFTITCGIDDDDDLDDLWDD